MSKIIEDELSELLNDEPWSDELPASYEVWEGYCQRNDVPVDARWLNAVRDWTAKGKSEGKVDVLKHLPSGRFFKVSIRRRLDHWGTFETTLEGVCEVEPYEAKVILWKEVI